jgi:hypothetical protein
MPSDAQMPIRNRGQVGKWCRGAASPFPWRSSTTVHWRLVMSSARFEREDPRHELRGIDHHPDGT